MNEAEDAMTNRGVYTGPMHGIGDLARALGGDETSFTGDLLRLIAKAQMTPENYAGLKRGFPRHVRAWELWIATSPPATGDELLAMLGPSFTCPRCGRTSWSAEDAASRYCGACHDYTGTV